MKLRLLVIIGIILPLSILTCCSNQLQRENEYSIVESEKFCKFYTNYLIGDVVYVSFACKENDAAHIDWMHEAQYEKSFHFVHHNKVVQGKEKAQPPVPEPSNAVDENQYAGVAYLTFDDGPGKLTGEVLDILADNHINATFFVLGQQVERYPELLQRITAEGHSVGNHTYNHVYDELYKSFTNFSEQVLQTSQAIYDITGVRTHLLRAPGGTNQNVDTSYYDAMSEAGYIIFDWNVDSGDSAGRNISKEKIVNNIMKSDLRKRVIVLMHDSNSHEATIEALPEIITYYRDQNYRFDIITETTEPMLSKITDNIRWDRKPVTVRQKSKFIKLVNDWMSQNNE